MRTYWTKCWKRAAALAAVFLALGGQPAQAVDRIAIGDIGDIRDLPELSIVPPQTRPLGWGGNSFGQVGDRGSVNRRLPAALPGGATAVDSANSHTLVRRIDGTVWAWGWNGNGELGDGTVNHSAIPVQVREASGQPLTNVVAVAAGDNFSLAVKADGSVWHWGTMTFSSGRKIPLGTRAVPAGLDRIIAVAAGRHHALALQRNGVVWAWGNNDFGQLGNGTETDNFAFNAPAPISGLLGVTAIAAGDYHSLALRSDGTVRGWGANTFGALGDGTTTRRYQPTPVVGVQGATAISAGFLCSAALLNDGTARAWGDNSTGQLGSAEWGTHSLGPVPVRGLTGARSIAVSAHHSLAVRTDGSVHAWGSNTSGELGNGAKGKTGAGTVSGLSRIALAAAGGSFSVTVNEDGRFLSWGRNFTGELGNGTLNSDPVLTPRAAHGVQTPVIAFGAGGQHSLALLPDGTVQAWGSDEFGQLGDGETPPVPSGEVFHHPFVLNPAGTARIRNMVAVSAGAFHSLILRNDGRVFAFGHNGAGQLGNGSTAPSSLPVLVKGPGTAAALTEVKAIATGGSHSLALRADGTVWAWGGNLLGQLGIGPASDSTRPVQVQGLTGVKAIAAGGAHCLALKADGTVWAWGGNAFGQIGIGSFSRTVPQPVQVSGLAGVRRISAGEMHSLALMADGTVRGWGANGAGQLGDGTRTHRLFPKAVSGLSGVTAIAAGGLHSAALVKDGTMRAWGENASGQLGDGTTTPRLTPVTTMVFPVVAKLTNVALIAAGGQHTFAGTVRR